LFDGIRLYGGRVATLMQETCRREEAFCREQDRKVGSNWDWQRLNRDGLRRVLGFRIGDGAVDVLDPSAVAGAAVAAVATGPP
jgi:hypothetical protein